MTIEQKLAFTQEIVKIIKDLSNPFVWATEFRTARSKFIKDSELQAIAKACAPLSAALYKLERNASYSLYQIVPEDDGDPGLTDEQLQDEAILKNIAKDVHKLTKDYKRVWNAFVKVEKRAYKKLGDVIVELGKGLDERRELLTKLASIVIERKSPQEIREIGARYAELIDTIQPIREEIRHFVAENS